MTFHWLYLDNDGQPAASIPEAATTSPFPTQADAEGFIGDMWKDLLDGGVSAVELYDGDHKIYGPMDLSPVAD